MVETIAEIEENFALLDSWEERYRYIIELGNELVPYPDKARDAAHKVPGCVSQVWLLAELDPKSDRANPVLQFKGDSDSHIVKGLIYIILALYSGKTAAQILEPDAQALLKRLHLQEHLTPQRSNGLQAMVQRICLIARQNREINR